MRAKKFLLVKGAKYELIFKDVVLDENGRDCYGTCDPDKKVIEISAKLRGKKKAQTFLHELGHALIFETHLNEGLDENIVEIIVELFAAYYSDKVKIDF